MLSVRARAPLLALLLLALMPESRAQTLPALRLLDPVWGAPSHCTAMLDRLNQRASESRVEDFLAAGLLLETSDCVVRNETRASQFYAQAARRGSPAAARRLAVLFGSGRGVPQSYANAGAWLAGKGDTDERIEPWDYSIGYAYTLIATTLDRLRYPQDVWPQGFELTLALEVDAQGRGRVGWRVTGENTIPALAAALTAAFDNASALALAQVAPVDPRYLVAARVTLPITVRRDADTRFVVTEREPLLR